MRNLLFTCPRTGQKVQGLIAKEVGSSNAVCVPVECPICDRPHLIDPRTGKVPSGPPETKV